MQSQFFSCRMQRLDEDSTAVCKNTYAGSDLSPCLHSVPCASECETSGWTTTSCNFAGLDGLTAVKNEFDCFLDRSGFGMEVYGDIRGYRWMMVAAVPRICEVSLVKAACSSTRMDNDGQWEVDKTQSLNCIGSDFWTKWPRDTGAQIISIVKNAGICEDCVSQFSQSMLRHFQGNIRIALLELEWIWEHRWIRMNYIEWNGFGCLHKTARDMKGSRRLTSTLAKPDSRFHRRDHQVVLNPQMSRPQVGAEHLRGGGNELRKKCCMKHHETANIRKLSKMFKEKASREWICYVVLFVAERWKKIRREQAATLAWQNLQKR